MRYATAEKELLSVVYAVSKFRKYLLDKSFKVYTDNSAVAFLFKKNVTKSTFAAVDIGPV